MYSILYSIYFLLRRVIRRYGSQQNRQTRIAQKIIGRIESYYNVFLKRFYKRYPRKNYGITQKKRKQKVIISFTSFPARIDTVWLTVESLFQQNMKADEIILWLAREQFPDKKFLPESLLSMEKRGLTIRFCDDLRSHKKYFYAMQENPNDLIVLADDDAFYPRDMIKKLYKLHEKYPKDIISSTSAITTEGYHALPSRWHAPEMNQKLIHSYIAQPFTGQGTLYPPNAIDSRAFEKELAMKLCPYADDLWLFFMALNASTAVTSVFPYRDIPVTIDGTGASSLWQINGRDMKNDEQWSAILDWFGDKNLPEEVV